MPEAVKEKRCAAYTTHLLHEEIPRQAWHSPASLGLTLSVPSACGRHEILPPLGNFCPREREFLELRYGLELSDGEIALIYGTSREAIRKRYERLLAKCRRM